MKKLTIDDLKPVEATFTLSETGEQVHTFRKFTLLSQIWLRDRFGKENVKGIFENQSLPEIAELAFYQLKDKSHFKDLNQFMENIVTQQDRINLMSALLKTIGISQPILEKLSKEVESDSAENPPVPTLPTGETSTT